MQNTIGLLAQNFKLLRIKKTPPDKKKKAILSYVFRFRSFKIEIRILTFAFKMRKRKKQKN